MSKCLRFCCHTSRLNPEVLLEFSRECLFLLRVSRDANPFKMDLHACRQWTVRQEVVESRIDQNLCSSLRSKGSALSYLLHPGSSGLDMGTIAVAHIQAQPGIIRNNIGCHASAFIDIMNPCGRLDVLAHQVESMREEFCRMYRTPSQPGSPCGMCPFSEKLNLHLVEGGRAVIADPAQRARMPVKRDVKINK